MPEVSLFDRKGRPVVYGYYAIGIRLRRMQCGVIIAGMKMNSQETSRANSGPTRARNKT